MTEIKIKSISYRNFKNLKDYKLILDSNNAVINGLNGTGKTTLADGMTWLFYGKSTIGEKLNPKPLDKDNQEVLGVEPEIEAELVIDGKSVTLKRVQTEVWTKKRGELESTRGSDKTNYYIDGVPKKEKEWKEYLADLGEEELVRILSNPGAFMRSDWKARRETLVSLSGLSDEEIISKNKSLAELTTLLDGHTIDDYRKIIAAQRKNIKNDIDGFTGRVQENYSSIERLELEELSKDELTAQVATLQAEVDQANNELAAVKNGDATLDYQEQLANLKIKIAEEKNAFLASSMLVLPGLQNDYNSQQELTNEIKRSIVNPQDCIEYNTRKIKELHSRRETLLREYKELKVMTFDDHKTTCKMCGQELPEDQKQKIIENFNVDKSKQLEINIDEGKALKLKIEELEQEVVDNKQKIDKITPKYNESLEQLEIINQGIEEEKSKQGNFEDTDKYKTMVQQGLQIKQEIDDARADKSGIVTVKQEAVDHKKAELQTAESLLAKFAVADGIEKRINELKEQDKAFKDQYQETERQLFLLDEFVRIKVKSIEDSVNKKFKLVNFKLFETQKNGGINEVCEATYKGVDYSGGLNNGARINCDLDIINTLSKEINLQMPVFVDNAESVNELISTDAQTVKLCVSTDKKMKVEVEK